MKKNIIRVSESNLRKIISESIKNVLKESKVNLINQIYEYVDENGMDASGGKMVFFPKGTYDSNNNELIYLWIDETGKLTVCSEMEGQEQCTYLEHFPNNEIYDIFNKLIGDVNKALNEGMSNYGYHDMED